MKPPASSLKIHPPLWFIRLELVSDTLTMMVMKPVYLPQNNLVIFLSNLLLRRRLSRMLGFNLLEKEVGVWSVGSWRWPMWRR